MVVVMVVGGGGGGGGCESHAGEGDCFGCDDNDDHTNN